MDTRYQTIELERQHDWLTIWLNRPDSRNALSSEMIGELREALEAVADDRALRGLTLRGRGGVFCAGADLKAFEAMARGELSDADAVARMNLAAGQLFERIETLPQVVLVLVEGAAMAGGLGIACCADVVAVAPQAKFALTETTLGIPPAQIAPYVVDRLGLRTARRLMLTAARFDGAEAASLGARRLRRERDGSRSRRSRPACAAQVRRCAPGANAVTKEIVLAARRLHGAALQRVRGHAVRALHARRRRSRGHARLRREAQAGLGDQRDPKASLRHFHSILVANRGEIALRVMRTAERSATARSRSTPRRTRGAPHVRAADDAFLLGAAAAAESYLNVDRLLAAAAATGAEAIHPGYGFLSENADFARGGRGGGAGVHRADAGGHRADGQQGGGQAPHARGRGALRARLRRAGPVGRGACRRARAADRLSGDGQGRGRRRWPRHAPRAEPQALAAARCAAHAPRRDQRLRLRRTDPRAGDPPAAARRDPGLRRRAGQHHPSQRARLLGAAPAPEGRSRKRRARYDAGAARAHGRAARSRRRAASAIAAPARSSSCSTPAASSTSSR